MLVRHNKKGLLRKTFFLFLMYKSYLFFLEICILVITCGKIGEPRRTIGKIWFKQQIIFMDSKETDPGENLQNRREFFKEAARKTLPILAAVALPSLLQSCDKDLWTDPTNCPFDCTHGCQSNCKGSCSSSCTKQCGDSCLGKCTGACKGSCGTACSLNCRGKCTKSGRL